VTRPYGTEPSILDSLRIRKPRRVDESAAPDPAIVFVHGSMDRQAAFARVVRHLPDVTTAVYDRRGYGASVEIAGPFDVDDHVADLDRVLDVVDPTRGGVVLIGHSFGGVVSLAMASRRPERVLAVGVYESPMSWEPWWSSTSGGARAVETRHDPELAAENFLKRFIGEQRWNDLPEGVKIRRRREGRALVGELADIRRSRPYRFADIRCPVVSAVGSHAPEHMRRGAQLLADECSPRPPVVIEGAQHNAPFSHPQIFADTVVKPTSALAAGE
jgi:pimeloyl-ACP methyl ester carboxylesterase